MTFLKARSDPLGLWQMGDLDVGNLPWNQCRDLLVELGAGVEEDILLNFRYPSELFSQGSPLLVVEEVAICPPP